MTEFFLHHLSQLEFVLPDAEEGLFLGFPDNARNSLAQLLCENFASGKIQLNQVSSCVHLRVYMEIIGQCFSLPLQYHTTIESALNLYKSWLLDPKRQPEPLKQDEQYFYKQMFKQLSLIFTLRVADLDTGSRTPNAGKEKLAAVSEDIEIHIKFCRMALNIYRSAGVKYGRQMSDDTWELLLKIILGITDSMLVQPRGTSMVVEQMISDLINLLFELWLTSGTRPEYMWDKLTEKTKHWKHRIQTFIHWSSVCVAVNERVLQILYGPSIGTESIEFRRVDGELVELYLDDAYVLIVWHRMLHLLGQFEGTVSSSENYFEAIKGISKITRAFVELKNKNLVNSAGANIPPPSGNTILDMSGGWLLEAINTFQKGFDFGKTEALETLCLVFTSRPATDFHPNYLAHFYRGVEKALNIQNTVLLGVILKHSKPFFMQQYRGSHVLIPAFVLSFGRVLFPDVQGSVSKEQSVIKTHQSQRMELPLLQKASLKIMFSMLCLSKHYNDTQFNCASSQRPPMLDSLPLLQKFSNLNDHLSKLLIESLNSVTTPENRQLALWGGCVFAFEITDSNENGKKFTSRFILVLLDKIIVANWGSSEVRTALQILRDLVLLFPYLDDELALQVVSISCSFIADKLVSLSSKEDEELVCTAVESCLGWLLAGQWVIRFPECLKKVITTMEVGLSYHYDPSKLDPNTRTIIGKSIKPVFNYFFYAFINFFGQFPLPCGPDSVSSLHTEASLINESENALNKRSFKTFSLNNQLLTIAQFPREFNTECYCVSRGSLGRTIWRNKMNYHLQPIVEVTPEETEEMDTLDIPACVELEVINNEIFSSMSDEDKLLHEETLKFVEQNCKDEERILKERKYGLDIDISAKIPTELSGNPTTRLFCANLGFLSLANWGHFSPIKTKFDDTKEISQLKDIDKRETRECYSTGVLYFENGVPKFNSDNVSPDFYDFVWSLGWKIDISKHCGYKGGLSAKTGEFAPYYATHGTELIFQVGLLIPKDIKSNYIQNLIFSNQVIICWTDNMEKFDISLFKTEFQVLIVIEPQVTRLYHVKVFHPQSFSLLGPIQDDMLLSKRILGATVRLTVLNALRANTIVGEPANFKQSIISQEKENNENPKNLSEYYRPVLLS